MKFPGRIRGRFRIAARVKATAPPYGAGLGFVSVLVTVYEQLCCMCRVQGFKMFSPDAPRIRPPQLHYKDDLQFIGGRCVAITPKIGVGVWARGRFLSCPSPLSLFPSSLHPLRLTCSSASCCCCWCCATCSHPSFTSSPHHLSASVAA